MHRADIRAALQKKGLTLRQVSSEAGLSTSACGFALLYPSRKAEEAIAGALGKTPHELWPDRWDASGRRRVRNARTGTANADISARRVDRGQ